MRYEREDRWEFRYSIPHDDGTCEDKTCYPKSKEQIEKNKDFCQSHGYEVISINKLYPFSTMKNQHNFDLIHTLVMIDLYEIWEGQKQVSDEEYQRLEHLRDLSERFFSLPLPVAWLTWDDWKKAHELAQQAIIHRQNACIENGRPDLVTYC